MDITGLDASILGGIVAGVLGLFRAWDKFDERRMAKNPSASPHVGFSPSDRRELADRFERLHTHLRNHEADDRAVAAEVLKHMQESTAAIRAVADGLSRVAQDTRESLRILDRLNGRNGSAPGGG